MTMQTSEESHSLTCSPPLPQHPMLPMALPMRAPLTTPRFPTTQVHTNTQPTRSTMHEIFTFERAHMSSASNVARPIISLSRLCRSEHVAARPPQEPAAEVDAAAAAAAAASARWASSSARRVASAAARLAASSARRAAYNPGGEGGGVGISVLASFSVRT